MFFKQKVSEKNHKNKKKNDSTKTDSKKKGKEQKTKPVPDLICKVSLIYKLFPTKK